MPNNVETRMWLVSKDRKPLSEEQIEKFFSQFISIDPDANEGEEARQFDFNYLIPQPDNIWLGSIGGDEEENLKTIEEYGGLDAVKQALKGRKRFRLDKHPCLTDEQIKQFGMVNGLDWNREHWETKWGAYNCFYDWKATYGDGNMAHVMFDTAWSVPEKILRMVREKATEQGYDIICEFGGEMDNLGEYFAGKFMYWDAVWNEETETLERQGDPIDVHE